MRGLLALLDPPKNKDEQTPITPPVEEALRKQLEMEAAVIAALNPWQIANGLTYFALETGGWTSDPKNTEVSWSPFGFIADRTLPDYYTARFYRGLSLAQRDALIRGYLPFTALTPAQRDAAFQLCPEIAGFWGEKQEREALLGLQPVLPIGMYIYGYNGAPGFRVLPPIKMVMTSPRFSERSSD